LRRSSSLLSSLLLSLLASRLLHIYLQFQISQPIIKRWSWKAGRCFARQRLPSDYLLFFCLRSFFFFFLLDSLFAGERERERERRLRAGERERERERERDALRLLLLLLLLLAAGDRERLQHTDRSRM
jgi:hypothetical protein